MTTFIMMVGLSGSGKSYMAQDICNRLGYALVSSDSYREQEYGDEKIQGDNGKLFEKIHRDILEKLSKGISVVFDATNITYKTRVPLLEKVSKISGVEKKAIVVATQYEVCQRNNKNRSRIIPEYVIERQWKQFQMPQYNEGFDHIELAFMEFHAPDYNATEYMNSIMYFEQDNPHHDMTLGEHIISVMGNVARLGGSELLLQAALYHDNGKRFTKVFKNTRGEPSEIAHYFGHPECGAYEAMFYLMVNTNFNYEQIIWITGIIQYHMRLYACSTEKAKGKLLRQVGERMYSELVLLNEADKEGKKI